MNDPFMLDVFATTEVLHSTLIRLRGKYSVFVTLEKYGREPDAAKIDLWNKRTTELTLLIDEMITATLEDKKSAIKIYSKELRHLNESVNRLS
jgi:hypothetical protein